jgi:hypothetical protein
MTGTFCYIMTPFLSQISSEIFVPHPSVPFNQGGFQRVARFLMVTLRGSLLAKVLRDTVGEVLLKIIDAGREGWFL